MKPYWRILLLLHGRQKTEFRSRERSKSQFSCTRPRVSHTLINWAWAAIAIRFECHCSILVFGLSSSGATTWAGEFHSSTPTTRRLSFTFTLLLSICTYTLSDHEQCTAKGRRWRLIKRSRRALCRHSTWTKAIRWATEGVGASAHLPVQNDIQMNLRKKNPAPHLILRQVVLVCRQMLWWLARSLVPIAMPREIDSSRGVFTTSLMPQVEQVGSDLYVNLSALYPEEVVLSG